MVKPLRAVAASLVTERTMLLSFSVNDKTGRGKRLACDLSYVKCHIPCVVASTYQCQVHSRRERCQAPGVHHRWGSIGLQTRGCTHKSKPHERRGYRRTARHALHEGCARGVLRRRHTRCRRMSSLDGSGSSQRPSRRPCCWEWEWERDADDYSRDCYQAVQKGDD